MPGSILALNEAPVDSTLDPRPLIMGILNVTPDSFSDGGLHLDSFMALKTARSMVEEGVDWIDLGGESTRPGSLPVSPSVQLERVLPVLEVLIREGIAEGPVSFSIDTSSSLVAEACLDRGCTIVNDVTAGYGDPHLLKLVARHRARVILMHMQGEPRSMQDQPRYGDVVDEVCCFLQHRVNVALEAGISKENILVDPGIGFGKSKEHNLCLIRDLDRIVALGFPVVLGTSRKRFMGSLCHEKNPLQLTGATVATTTYGVLKGVRVFRVHEVRPNRQAADVSHALKRPRLFAPGSDGPGE